jgi:hypothetical protein
MARLGWPTNVSGQGNVQHDEDPPPGVDGEIPKTSGKPAPSRLLASRTRGPKLERQGNLASMFPNFHSIHSNSSRPCQSGTTSNLPRKNRPPFAKAVSSFDLGQRPKCKIAVESTNHWRNVMKKVSVAIATAVGVAILCAAPVSLHRSHENVLSVSQDSAYARVGRPLTPVSVAGVHRRAVRRCAAGVTCHHYY